MHTLYIFVSHNRDEVYRLCKKLAVLHHGKVEVTGEKREIFRNPQTVSAAALTGCENIAAFVVKEQTLYCEEWNLKKRGADFEKVKGAFLGIRACDIKGGENERTCRHQVHCGKCDRICRGLDLFFKTSWCGKDIADGDFENRCRFTKKDMRYSFPFRERRFCF